MQSHNLPIIIIIHLYSSQSYDESTRNDDGDHDDDVDDEEDDDNGVGYIHLQTPTSLTNATLLTLAFDALSFWQGFVRMKLF